MIAGLAVIPTSPTAADGNEVPGAPLLARSITQGTAHSCARMPDGTVKCWGSNSHGQIGLGPGQNRGDTPNEMGDLLPTVSLGSTSTVTALSAGASHTCGVLTNGNVKCWGRNDNAQLGLGDTNTRGDGPSEMGNALPSVGLGAGRTATAVSAGLEHTCALLDNGSVKCWGDNGEGRLGQGDTATRGDAPGEMDDSLLPISLGTGRTATAITAGDQHTCALLDNGTVKCWGFNSDGQLGLGDTADRGDGAGEMGDSLPAVALGTGRTATAVTAGGTHTCALLDNATQKCWGGNVAGELGLGDTAARGNAVGEMGDSLPAVDLGAGRSALAMTAGRDSTCVVLDNSRLKCWGRNIEGQLGIGDTANRGDGPGEVGDQLPHVVLTGAAIDQGIFGRVTDQTTNSGVSVMIAALSTTDFSFVAGTFSNGNGDYAIPLPIGSYYLYLVTTTYSNTFFGAPTAIQVTSNDVTDADQALAPVAGTVSGTVTDSSTTAPVAGAWTVALNSAGVLERIVDGTPFQMTLPPGQHYLAYVDPTGAHDTRFYPSSPTLPASTPVNVTAGTTVAANGSLPPQAVPPASNVISGTVVDNVGNPVTTGRVIALRSSDFGLAKGGTIASNGTYSLLLPAGNYYIGFLSTTGAFTMEWYADQPAHSLGTATLVAAPSVNVNAIVTATVGRMRGDVGYGGGQFVGLWVFAIGPNGLAGTAVSQGDLGYTIANLPVGTYRAAFLDPNGGRLEYWENKATHAEATTFSILGGLATEIDGNLLGPP